MHVTLSLSRQQRDVLQPLANGMLEQLVAQAFDEYCRDHPEELDDRPRAD
jgi:hypothetical protein